MPTTTLEQEIVASGLTDYVGYLLWSVAKYVVYFFFFVWMFSRLRPAYVQFDKSRQTRFQEVPARMVAFVHAIYTVLYGYGYLFAVFDVDQLYWARDVSTSFLVFDVWQTFVAWRRDGIRSVAAHPYGVAFHHSITVLFIHGWLLPRSLTRTALLVYFVSELPVIFLNITWLYIHLGKQNTRQCAVCSSITLVTYFVCRIVLFALIFLFVLLPRMPLWNPLSYVTLVMLALVYLLNVLWFVKLVKKNGPFAKKLLQIAPWLITLPQYNCAPLLPEPWNHCVEIVIQRASDMSRASVQSDPPATSSTSLIQPTFLGANTNKSYKSSASVGSVAPVASTKDVPTGTRDTLSHVV